MKNEMDFDFFLSKYQKVPVEHYPSQHGSNPLVSIIVVTYQHVNYIEQCLDGILMQKTDFNYEILLGEDASTDGTREICLKYANLYPDKIRLFLHHRENNISISGQFTGRFNFLYNLYSAKGKYIALCEGDDYWTDPLKLQKQVDFLDGNKNFAGIGSNSDILFQETQEIKPFRNLSIDKVLDINDFLGPRVFHTASFIFKNNITISTAFPAVLSADRLLFLIIASKGNIYYQNESTCIYRKNQGGISSRVTSSQMIYDIRFLKVVKDFLDKNKLHILEEFILRTILDYSHVIKFNHFVYVTAKLLLVSNFNYKTRKQIKNALKKVRF